VVTGLAVASTDFGYSDLDFTADEFLKLTDPQRVRLCRLLARRAEELATGDSKNSHLLLQIAKSWSDLADTMEKQD
jgi:hypothetical protein